jgi:hypothetical protein
MQEPTYPYEDGTGSCRWSASNPYNLRPGNGGSTTVTPLALSLLPAALDVLCCADIFLSVLLAAGHFCQCDLLVFGVARPVGRRHRRHSAAELHRWCDHYAHLRLSVAQSRGAAHRIRLHQRLLPSQKLVGRQYVPCRSVLCPVPVQPLTFGLFWCRLGRVRLLPHSHQLVWYLFQCLRLNGLLKQQPVALSSVVSRHALRYFASSSSCPFLVLISYSSKASPRLRILAIFLGRQMKGRGYIERAKGNFEIAFAKRPPQLL